MDTTPGFPTLRIVSHPLVQHKLSILRDRETPTKIFKELVDEIAMLMAYEATSDLALEDAIVDTPLERTVGRRVSGKKLTLVPILRAGLGMVEGIYGSCPGARRPHRAVSRSRHARAGRLLFQGSERRAGARLHPARPDAGDRRQRRRGGHVAQARRRDAHPLHVPRRGAGRRQAAGDRASRRHRSTARRSIASSTSRATSCPGSATPATGCSARASDLAIVGRGREARTNGRRISLPADGRRSLSTHVSPRLRVRRPTCPRSSQTTLADNRAAAARRQ